MSVPETTIDEYCDVQTSYKNIRTTGKIIAVESIPDSKTG